MDLHPHNFNESRAIRLLGEACQIEAEPIPSWSQVQRHGCDEGLDSSTILRSAGAKTAPHAFVIHHLNFEKEWYAQLQEESSHVVSPHVSDDHASHSRQVGTHILHNQNDALQLRANTVGWISWTRNVCGCGIVGVVTLQLERWCFDVRICHACKHSSASNCNNAHTASCELWRHDPCTMTCRIRRTSNLPILERLRTVSAATHSKTYQHNH